MPLQKNYPPATPVPGDFLTGRDTSNTGTDAGGATSEFPVEEMLLSRAGIVTKNSASNLLGVGDFSTKGTQIIFVNTATASEVVLQTDAAAAVPIGAGALIVWEGVGQVSIRAASGVSLWGISAAVQTIQNRRGSAYVFKRAANSWAAVGDLGAPA